MTPAEALTYAADSLEVHFGYHAGGFTAPYSTFVSWLRAWALEQPPAAATDLFATMAAGQAAEEALRHMFFGDAYKALEEGRLDDALAQVHAASLRFEAETGTSSNMFTLPLEFAILRERLNC